MTDYLVTDTELTDVADAIRTKGGTSAALEWPDDYVDAIDAIETGGGGVSTRTVTISGGRHDSFNHVYYTDGSLTLCYLGAVYSTPFDAVIGSLFVMDYVEFTGTVNGATLVATLTTPFGSSMKVYQVTA